jgi:hypothetical protein
MNRLWGLVAGLIFALLAAAPASAGTIATFELNGVKFSDGGMASGTFTLDLATHTIQSSAITTSFKNFIFVGGNYDGSPFDSFTALPTADVQMAAWGIPFLSAQLLTLQFGLTDATDLSTVTSFIAAGSEKVYSFLCKGLLCGTRTIVAGTFNVVAATPIPAALPLLATALGFMGFMGWRRKGQQNADA